MTTRDLILPILWRAIPGGNAILLPLLGAIAFAFGSLVTIALLRGRRRITDRFGADAVPLSPDVESLARDAVSDERRRIAREVQEIVAHRLVVITTLADGASATARKAPDDAIEAMNHVATTSRQTLKDLRRFVDRLRHESDRPPTRS